MFILSECILFVLMCFNDSVWIKYLSIMICFLYAVYKKKGYGTLGIVLLADYCLLIHNEYELGVFLFILVQCCYHEQIGGSHQFYLLLYLILYPKLIVLVICYGLMSVINFIQAYQKDHWLWITIGLLMLCDLCVATQYLLLQNIFLIWWFYLPSQVYYVKMVSSI